MSIKKRVGNLLIGNKEGKTFLEKMVSAKDHKVARPEDNVYNPLHLAIKDMVELRFEEAGTYEVYQITAYATHLSNTSYQAVRYFLKDSVEVEEAESLILELLNSEKNHTPIQYLFHIIEELEYDEEFLELVEDDIFVITEETDDEEIEKEYEKTYHITSDTTTIDQERRILSGAVKVWNYELEHDMETSYLTIEMDTNDGWTTIYEGRKLLAGEFELYQLSE